jgi:hypothetical protein
MGNFPLATCKCTWVQTVPPTAWQGKGLLNARFYLLGGCIIKSYLIIAMKTDVPLCCKCADSMLQVGCTHSDDERCIVGTWVADKVRKAVEMG